MSNTELELRTGCALYALGLTLTGFALGSRGARRSALLAAAWCFTSGTLRLRAGVLHQASPRLL